jgi:CubicO group peptidase (beta-lactamase class C family)
MRNEGRLGLSAGRLAEIAPMLQGLVDERQLAGAVTLVWRRGELAHVAAVGYRDVAAAAPMTRDALFRIASMTKPIVSLTALMLLEEGKLELDDPVTRWLPELADRRVLNDAAGPLDDTRPALRDITVEDLMTHRSGLASGFTSVGPIAAAYGERLGSPFAAPKGPDAWLRALAELPLSYSPGQRFHYGHSTDVLGLLIARIEGGRLGEILQRRIFDPLGMADTVFSPAVEAQSRLARLYRAATDRGPLQDVSFPVPEGAPVFESGGGGLFSTADDYLKFARLMLERGEVDGVRLVRTETIDRMIANRLTPGQRAIPFLGASDWWTAQGFGLGVSMVLDPVRHARTGAGSRGSFGWPGAFGTWWTADPTEDMVLIYLMQDSILLTPGTVSQLVNHQSPARKAQLAFQKMVYTALEERRAPGA